MIGHTRLLSIGVLLVFGALFIRGIVDLSWARRPPSPRWPGCERVVRRNGELQRVAAFSATTRKPRFPVEETGSLPCRAETR